MVWNDLNTCFSVILCDFICVLSSFEQFWLISFFFAFFYFFFRFYRFFVFFLSILGVCYTFEWTAMGVVLGYHGHESTPK